MQDHLFVLSFQAFSQQLVEAASAEDVGLLRGGLAALDDELSWMQASIPAQCRRSILFHLRGLITPFVPSGLMHSFCFSYR